MINFLYLIKFLECGHFAICYILRKEKIKRKVKYNGILMSMGLVKRVMEVYFNCVSCYMIYDVNDIGNRRVISLLKIGKSRLHYIVIERVKKGYVYFYDPLFINLRKMKIKKFEKKWSNICCLYGEKSNC